MEELILGGISRDICLPRLPWSCPVRQDGWARHRAMGAAPGSSVGLGGLYRLFVPGKLLA